MKYCLILFMILFGTFSNAQSENSFYVKNKNDGEVKKVYFIGDIVLAFNTFIYFYHYITY